MTTHSAIRLVRWKLGAKVLAWPVGDSRPFLAEIDGQAWNGAEVVPRLRTPWGWTWASPSQLSPAKPVLDALVAGKKIEWGHG